jgi:hypothetical protein
MQLTETLEQTQPIPARSAPIRLTISVGVVAYAALVVLSLALRLTALGAVPLSDAEARQALASWRTVSPTAPGAEIAADSPLRYLLQNISFSLLGASEFSARITTALIGAALVLSPLLFRDLLGRGRAFFLALLLTLSSVLLTASRESSGVVLAAGCAVVGLWTLRRYWLSGAIAYGGAAVIMFAALLFLSEPAGYVLGLALGGAALIAVIFGSDEAAFAENDNSEARQRWIAFPWRAGVPLAAAMVLLVATGFMLYPQGLNAVGELVGTGLRGFVERPAGAIWAFPLAVSLFYEPIFWLFGLAAVIILFRRREWTFVERFLVGWLVTSVLASLLYVGADAAHALWLTLPLAALATYVLPELLVDDLESLIWVTDVEADEAQRTHTLHMGRLIVALSAVALLLMLGIHLRVVSMALLGMPPESPLTSLADTLMSGLMVNVRISVVWLMISALFMLVGYFLAANIWGGKTTLQGGALGVLVFGLVIGIGGGWRAAVSGASDALELWHTQVTSPEVFVLRETLIDLTDRQTGGFLEVSISALVPQDGVVAWMLRDFENTRFITNVNDAAGEGIVLLPSSAEPPPLGEGYVGQNFLISESWSIGYLQGVDILAWWTQRRALQTGTFQQITALWLRADVFAGQ